MRSHWGVCKLEDDAAQTGFLGCKMLKHRQEAKENIAKEPERQKDGKEIKTAWKQRKKRTSRNRKRSVRSTTKEGSG